MFCQKCGKQNDDSAQFCASCGNSFSQTKPPVVVSQKVPNYLVHAIIATIFCFLPTGITAIVYSTKVNSLLATGDIEGAKSASKTAKLFVNISVVLGILAAIFYVLVFSGGGYNSGC